MEIKQEPKEIYQVNAIFLPDHNYEFENELEPLHEVKNEAGEPEDLRKMLKGLREVQAEDSYVESSNLETIKQEIDLETETGIQPLGLSEQPCSSKDWNQLIRKPVKKVVKEGIKKKRRFPCPVCRKKISPSHSRKKHVDSHFKKHLVTCYSCGVLFNNKTEYLIHISVHFVKSRLNKAKVKITTNIAPYNDRLNILKCHKCSQVFFDNDSLTKHVHTHYRNDSTHSSRPAVFIHCENYSPIAYSDQKLHACDYCNESFLSVAKLKRHFFNHIKLFECDVCSKRLNSEKNLSRHKKLHTALREVKCLLCPKKFSTKIGFKQHLRAHSSQKPYYCQMCLKIFQKADIFRTHLFDHHTTQKLELLKCQICSLIFRSDTDFRKHFRIVHADCQPTTVIKAALKICGNPLINDESIPTNKDNNDTNNTELVVVSKIEKAVEGMYKCDMCPKGFDDKKTFKVHVTNHKFSQKCVICSETLYSRHLLRKHLDSHTPRKKPFFCEICTCEFVRRLTLQKHLYFEQRQDVDDIVMKCEICYSPVHYFSKTLFHAHLRNCHTPNFDAVESNFTIVKEEIDVDYDDFNIKQESEGGDFFDLWKDCA